MVLTAVVLKVTHIPMPFLNEHTIAIDSKYTCGQHTVKSEILVGKAILLIIQEFYPPETETRGKNRSQILNGCSQHG